jgi:hypothetical protein
MSGTQITRDVPQARLGETPGIGGGFTSINFSVQTGIRFSDKIRQYAHDGFRQETSKENADRIKGRIP